MTKNRSVGCRLCFSELMKNSNLPNRRTFKKVKIAKNGEYNNGSKSLKLKQSENNRI